MRKDEILQFIKEHTLKFEKELRAREKRKVSFPRPGFERTAACNIQRRMDFDQDAVIQQQWQNMVDYIVQVKPIVNGDTYVPTHNSLFSVLMRAQKSR